MPLPSFLVIGAAKSGTTTLFSDLDSHPDVFFPVVKEPGDLTRDEVLEDRGLAAYAQLFRAARPGQVCGEASTIYTARPMFEGAPERARRVLGGATKLIYLVRDPFDRVLSEHRYSALQGKIPGDINLAIRETPRIIERSRYAYQVQPWLEKFGRDQLTVVVFEDYIKQREATVAKLFDVLGVPRLPDHQLPASKNKTSDVVIARGPLRRLVRTEFYRRTVRRLVPASVRERAKPYFGRHSRVVVSQQLTREHEQLLLDQLRPDVEEFHRMVGWTSPVWSRFA